MLEESTRRLASIMIADIVGYSRIMGADERGTHQRLQRLFHELVEPTIAEHRGRLVKRTGDGFLAMFDSPVEAVRCAIVIQQSMVGRNLELPAPQWIRFRIGVNLGDVIVEHDDVYGEGVNIAARLEQLAEPGAIYISGGVYEQIRFKLVCGYQSLGDRKIKHISDPVPIYSVLPDPAAVVQATRGRASMGLILAGLLGLGLGGGGWYLWTRNTLVASSPAPAFTSAASPSAIADAAPPAPATPTPSLTVVARPDPPAPIDRPVVSTPAAAAIVMTRPSPLPTSKGGGTAAAPPVVPDALRITEPEMIPIVGGSFKMGSTEEASERPVHKVAVAPFLLAKYPVTLRQWRECVRAKGCSDVMQGDDDAPVSNASWDDAQHFVAWLSQATGRSGYRLPSEAEWEYAARGGTQTRYWWGNAMQEGMAVCKGCGRPGDAVRPVKVGTRPSNPFGLSDISGGLSEWVEDCWHKNYQGAPIDGSAWLDPDCRERVLRGGSWNNTARDVRSSSREVYDASVRYPTHGFRVARSPSH